VFACDPICQANVVAALLPTVRLHLQDTGDAAVVLAARVLPIVSDHVATAITCSLDGQPPLVSKAWVFVVHIDGGVPLLQALSCPCVDTWVTKCMHDICMCTHQ
jgi:hypothetical protein